MSPAPLRLAIAGANATRARTIADGGATAFGARRAFDDTPAMARDPDVDIVAVTAKVPGHRAIAPTALTAGKHVHRERPLGRDPAETRDLAEAAA